MALNKRKAKKAKTKKDLMSVDISSLDSVTINQYKRVARELVRQTVKRWEKEDYKSPAYYALMQSTGGKGKILFSGKQTLNQQKKELAKAVRFLSDPSVSRKGWKQIKQQNIESLYDASGIALEVKDYDIFFKTYEKLKELNSAASGDEYRYEIMARMEAALNDENGLETEDGPILNREDDEKAYIDQLAIQMDKELKNMIHEKEAEHKRNLTTRSQRIK